MVKVMMCLSLYAAIHVAMVSTQNQLLIRQSAAGYADLAQLGTNTVSTGMACRECERGYTPNSIKSDCVLIPPSYLTWSHGWSIVILILTRTRNVP